MDIIKIGVMGMVGVLLALTLKYQKPEYSFFISLGVCVFIFLFIMDKMHMMLNYIQEIAGFVDFEGRYIETILKMIGITYVAEFAANICRDAGYGAIAGQIQMFAKLSILALSMPVLLTFMKTIGDFL